METLRQLADVFLHLDAHLTEWVQWMGPWLYVVLFAVIFAETGPVVTPFLPGDSLLFAVGALAALPNNGMSIWILIPMLIIAAILGDAVNYAIGRRLGPKVFSRTDSKLLNREHLLKAQKFYDKYGAKTIVLARFVPIVRTFAPFVAGVGKMNYGKFAFYNVTGGIAWVLIFTIAGYVFGNLEVVKRNFQYVILAIIVVSILPIVFEWWKARRERKQPVHSHRP